jgi:hypothetical protein
MTTTLASLQRNDPLPPVPAGAYECWRHVTELRIVRVVRHTSNDFGQIAQVWPPVKHKEKQS